MGGDLIRTTTIRVGAGADALTPSRFAGYRVRCQPGGPERSGEQCVACPRFRSYMANATTRTITILCRWRPDEPARGVMAMGGAVVAVSREETALVSAWRARAVGAVTRILVTDRAGEVVGTMRANDLAPPYLRRDDTAGHRMSPRVHTVGLDATIDDTRAALAAACTDCVLVVAAGTVWGVVAAEQLADAAA